MLVDTILRLLPWLPPSLLMLIGLSALPLPHFLVFVFGFIWLFLLLRYSQEDRGFAARAIDKFFLFLSGKKKKMDSRIQEIHSRIR